MRFATALLGLLGALTFVQAEENEIKAEQACQPCGFVNACAQQCSDENKLAASVMLVDNFCTFLDTDNIPLVQSMTLPKSTLRFVVQTNEGCFDSGIHSFMPSAVQLMTLATCPNNPKVVSSYVDEVGNVVIFADGVFGMGEIPVDVRGRYTFEPTGNCQMKLVDVTVRQAECF